jgi:hypothetical protein
VPKKEFSVKSVKSLIAVGTIGLALCLSACLNDSGSSRSEGKDANLLIVAGVKDVNKVKGLGKSSVISLKKLVITLRSSDTADAIRRDTVLADTGLSFVSSATADQTFNRSYAIKPLRSWTIFVKTLDANDSVIHYDSTVASNLLVGETRAVPLSLTSRYVMYEAQFTVPDSLHFQTAGVVENLLVKRVVMLVDGVIVKDTSTTPRFTPSTTTPPVTNIHKVTFDYIRSNQTPDVKIEFYGRLGNDTADSKLFEVEFPDVNPTNPNPPGKIPDYVGPGSEDLLAQAGLQITIGKVGTVVFVTNINGNVFKSAAE